MPAVVLACFFLSGASGLILELLWTRMLTLVFGSSALAVSTVLTAYMGGLGLGSFLAGKWADRLKDPVRAYALAEAGIGLYALAVPWLIGFYPGLNQWLWAAFGDRYTLLSLLRFVASAGLLIVPTTLMGATLPILARYFVSRPFELGRVSLRLGTLYAVNLFGAVAGSFFAGFVFLPGIGVRRTNLVAASFDLSLAAAILVAQRLLRARGLAEPRRSLDELAAAAMAESPTAKAAARPPLSRLARNAVLLSFAVSGATAMTLQVLWTRALAVIIGSSVFSFTIILLAFLIGLGTGSAAFGRLVLRFREPVRSLALTHLGIVACIGLSYLITDRLPFVFTYLLSSTLVSPDAVLTSQFVLACLTVLPSTFLMGAIFPITVRVVTGDLGTVGRDVGFAYALNTVGAILGSFLSGFVILPGLGLQRGIYLAAVTDLALAVLLFAVAPALPRPRRLAGMAAAVAMALFALALPRWNLTNFSIGFFRISMARDYIDMVEHRHQRKKWQVPKLVYYKDGIATTVSVDRWGKVFSMKNNGKVDASNDADMPTQISVGLLPLLLYDRDHPPKVALIGYGSGVTAGAATQYPIASLEVVELEPAVYEAAHFFDDVNHRPTENPKVRAIVGDGRNFLTQRRDRYDVIISQPSNPWITGVSNLFTREYFQSVKSRLAEEGIFCQWAQLYEMAPWNIKAIYRTLADEFPHVMVFAAEDLSSDTILLASRKPIELDLAKLKRAFVDPVTAAEAKRAGLASPHDVPAFLLLGDEELHSFVAGAQVNTDDNALIEFAAPRDLLRYQAYDPYLAKVYGPMWPYGHLTGVARGFDGESRVSDMARLARSLLAHGKSREAKLWQSRAEAAELGQEPPTPDVAHTRLLLDLVATREDRDPEIPLAPDEGLTPPVLPPGLPPDIASRVRDEYRDVAAQVEKNKYASAFKVIEDWPEETWGAKLGKDFALLTGFLDYKAEFYGDAIDELKPLADDTDFVRRRPELLYYLGRSYFANANCAKAVAALERYIPAQRALGRPLLPASAQQEKAEKPQTGVPVLP
ncbi:MAG: fused MFS/spermidine synthase [Deltaproteobacteria bacterium]|nr:fused MFS/spermidine synthase [Deltaproteobacteria bacterium]